MFATIRTSSTPRVVVLCLLLAVAAAWAQPAAFSGWNDPHRELSGSGDRFGSTLAVADDLLAVASLDTSSVFVYRRVQGGWSLATQIAPPADLPATAVFGAALAVGRDVVAVGTLQAGEVFIYQPSGAGWVLAQRLIAAGSRPGDRFGSAMAMWGDQLVVGASTHDGGSGAAYLFERLERGWVEFAQVGPPRGERGSRFAAALALEGDLMAVGASSASPSSTGSGRVYLYRLADGVVRHEATLVPADDVAAFGFGASLTLRGDLLAVGAPGDDFGGYPSGPVHLFERASAGWGLAGVVAPDNGNRSLRYGTSLAAGDGYVAVSGITDNDGERGELQLVLLRQDGQGMWTSDEQLTLTGNAVRYATLASDHGSLVAGVAATSDRGATVYIYALE